MEPDRGQTRGGKGSPGATQERNGASATRSGGPEGASRRAAQRSKPSRLTNTQAAAIDRVTGY